MELPSSFLLHHSSPPCSDEGLLPRYCPPLCSPGVIAAVPGGRRLQNGTPLLGGLLSWGGGISSFVSGLIGAGRAHEAEMTQGQSGSPGDGSEAPVARGQWTSEEDR